MAYVNMEAAIKNQIVNNYLSQQLGAPAPSPGQEGGGGKTGNYLATIDVPSQQELDEFKTHVRTWMEHDNVVKKMQVAIKEQNTAKAGISQKILTFMSKFNIEDLNTKEGKLRYRVSQVKTPVSQTVIKARFVDNYEQFSTISVYDMSKKIFESGTVKEKHSLRRGR